MIVWAVLVIFVPLLLLEAFFSGSEIALVAANRRRLQHLADKGQPGAALALKLLNKPDRLFATTLVGANLAEIGNTVLVTALLRVLKRESGLERMLLELERHGREDIFPDVDISRTTGWFTSAFPMTLRLQKSAGAREQVLSVREQLQAAPIGGIGYGLLRYLHEDEALHRQMQTIPDPQISFNYLGDFGRGQSAQEGERMQQPWAGRWQRILMQARKTLSHIAPQRIRVAEEEVGPEQHPDGERAAQLHIVSIVSADQLHVRWLYSRELHDRKTVERWANLYVQELANLVSQLVAGDN